MKESTTKYGRETWTDTYEDDEYYELLSECYENCKVPKEQGQKRHKWRCIHCEEVFRCRPGLNYHRYKVCPKVGIRLPQYPIVGKGQRIVMKNKRAIVKGELGKGKGHTQTHQPPVTTPNITSSSETSIHVSNLDVFEGIETGDLLWSPMLSENHQHVELEVGGEGHLSDPQLLDTCCDCANLFCLNLIQE